MMWVNRLNVHLELMRKLPLLLLFTLGCFTLLAQDAGQLFQKKTTLSADYRQVAQKYEALALNTTKLADLASRKPASLELQLPFEGSTIKLQLQRTNIISNDFSVIEALPGGDRRTINYQGGTHYQGKIEGHNNSFATFSIFNDQVMALIADDHSNIILGTIEQNGRPSNEYVLYRETDLEIDNPMNCFTEELPLDGSTSVDGINSQQSPNAVGEPVDIYFECDFKFYTDKGSNTINVINYVLGFFNNTALLYANEDIKIQVSQILVWTTLDPEAAANLNSTSTVLSAFSARMVATNYIGDYAHFLSTRSLGGGIAWLLNNPCGASKFNRTAVSAINNSYNNFPTYSWTVQVVTHELGHNLGSNHTQWCGWPGGPLDNCFTPEGACANGPTPVNGGTIMSYCHLTGHGINFNNGFGTLPGNKIRLVVTGSVCFGVCRMTIDVTKQDASCGQNNGSASVTATNGIGTLSYAWSNGQTGPTLTGVAPGTYHVRVSDESNCQVMQVVTIGNSGTSLSLNLTPGGTAGYCIGGSITLNATNNPAYTYVWTKDGNTIAGATSASLTANSPGLYAVTATSGACSGSSSVQVSEVAAPVANITPSGPTTFCDGSNIILNANAGSSYTYQWYNNNVAIPGATLSSYTAIQSGSYSVRVSAGSSCEATSTAIPITVNNSPAANLSAQGTTSFCAGNNVTLNASTGTGYTYQWYRNNVLINGATNSSYSATIAGNYTVTTLLGTCSRTSQPIPVTVWQNPLVSINPVTSTIEKFVTQTLTASGALHYNWTAHPEMVSFNGNSAVYRPLTSTDYLILGTDANGCTGTANARINVIGCGEVTNISATSYSPSRVIVRWTNPPGSTTDTLKYRIVGTSVWNRIFVTGQEFELNGLVPGANYEYSIIPLCSTTTVFIPSPTLQFATPALEGDIYIRLFPNPVITSSKLEIISSKPFTLQLATYDNAGRQVMNGGFAENFQAGQVIKNVNPGLLANGVYYLRATINGKNHTIKMMVMN